MVTLCQCGCGLPAPIAPSTDRSKGWVRGEPRPFRKGHHLRRTWESYPAPIRDEASGCLLWQGPVDKTTGYGRFGSQWAHRAAYERSVGPIPDGHQIDHVAARGCVHRHCVEPSHLEAVTQVENIRRQPNVLRQVEATECPSGHPYSGENLRLRVVNGRTKRGCRQCDRDHAAGRKQ